MPFQTPKQIRKTLTINKEQYDHFIKEGMPRLLIGTKLRFDKVKVVQWMQEYLLKQEQLEKSFVDAKERSIETYMTIDQLKVCLQLKKKVIRNLCKNGMPSTLIGDKKFFQLEEVLVYLRTQEKADFAVISRAEPTIIIVDGSYHMRTREVCTGMVVQGKEGVKGLATLHDTYVDNCVFCEYAALHQALVYVKNQALTNVIIGTDQKDIVSIFRKGERVYFKWMKKDAYKAIINGMYELMDELREHVQIVYANVPSYATLYANAHALSRYYENVVVDNLSANEVLTTKKKIERALPKLKVVRMQKNTEEKEQTLQIQFDCIHKNYAYFFVTIDGETKRTKMNNTTPTRAAVLLAYSYIQTAKGKMNVYIDAISTFKEDIRVIPSTSSAQNKVIHMIKTLYEVTNFYPQNDFMSYVENLKEKTNIA